MVAKKISRHNSAADS